VARFTQKIWDVTHGSKKLPTPGLVAKAEDSQLSDCEFKSRHRTLDICKLINHEIKVTKWGTPKKYLKN